MSMNKVGLLNLIVAYQIELIDHDIIACSNDNRI